MFDTQVFEVHVEQQMRQRCVPGLAIAAIRDRALCYARGFGVTSVEEGGVRVTPATVFHIASTTKPLTATAVMRLVEGGHLSLDRPVREYLPGLRFREPDRMDRITLRMLLSHTAGLPTEYQPYGPREQSALRSWTRRSLPKYKPVAPPGTRYAYSNVGFNLAGCVAEAVTGKPFPEVLRELLFEPLSMTRTTFDIAVAMTYPLALPHAGGEADDPAVVHRFPANAIIAPSGGALSTVLDLANFAELHLRGGLFGGQRLLAKASIEAMHSRHTPSGGPGDSGGYGLGFGTDEYKGARIVEHDGEGGWSTTQFLLAPDHGCGVVALCNAYRADFVATTASLALDHLLSRSTSG